MCILAGSNSAIVVASVVLKRSHVRAENVERPWRRRWRASLPAATPFRPRLKRRRLPTQATASSVKRRPCAVCPVWSTSACRRLARVSCRPGWASIQRSRCTAARCTFLTTRNARRLAMPSGARICVCVTRASCGSGSAYVRLTYAAACCLRRRRPTLTARSLAKWRAQSRRRACSSCYASRQRERAPRRHALDCADAAQLCPPRIMSVEC